MFVVVETMAGAFSLPKTASGWMFKHLDQLNIIYQSNPMELSDFMSLLKDRHDQPKLADINLSEEQKCLLDYTKNYWTLSFDFDIKRTGGRRRTQEVRDEQRRNINKGIREAEDFMTALRNETLEVFYELKRSNNFER